MVRFAVFTAIYGDRDILREPETDEVEYIVFTDRPLISRKARVIRLDGPFADPARNAKMVRALAHRFMHHYTATLWLDASFILRSVKGLLPLLDSEDIMVSRHYLRNCLYDEAEEILALGRDRREVVRPQIERYRREGYPVAWGLSEVGALLRRHTPAVRVFNETWWREIQSGSRHSQLSFDYVGWTLGWRPGWFEWPDVRTTPFWEMMPHSGPEPVPTSGVASTEKPTSITEPL